jgi:hypothetical protein
MSSSLPCNIEYVLGLITKNIFSKLDISKIDLKEIKEGKPIKLPDFKILDVGSGFGKWGFLIRDTFEVMMGQNFDKKDWKIELTGVESFSKCITPIQEGIYDKIINKDIFEIVDKLPKYDVIIMGDIIEHFDKKEAHELLDKLFKHSENIIISTPLGFMPQGEWGGNVKEIHKSGWDLPDFKKYEVVEHKILEDTVFSEFLTKLPNLPDEFKSKLKLLVLWVKKS